MTDYDVLFYEEQERKRYPTKVNVKRPERQCKMITEEELEHADFRYILHKLHLIIRDERKKAVEQLEKEADWLAENAGECPHMSGGSTFCWRHCPMWIGPRDRSGHCEKIDMREAARRAVQ